MDDLIKRLTKATGVNKNQAKGGLIALLRAGQQNMQRVDFEQFVADIPGADMLRTRLRRARLPARRRTRRCSAPTARRWPARGVVHRIGVDLTRLRNWPDRDRVRQEQMGKSGRKDPTA
jgi:hypothetical protein